MSRLWSKLKHKIMTSKHKHKVKYIIVIAVFLGFTLSLLKEDYAEQVGVEKSNSDTKSKTGLRQDVTWQIPEIPLDFLGLNQDDLRLVNHIRENWILPPSNEVSELANPELHDYSQGGQSEMVDGFLSNRRNGVFLECGAGDGEALSNSLFFENNRNWTGILIEQNPVLFKEMLKKKRNSYLVNACLSPTVHSQMANVTVKLSGSYDENKTDDWSVVTEMPCFPFSSVLQAVNITHLDYLSLDVDGQELQILDTIPWNRTTIDIITVAYTVPGCAICTNRKLQHIRNLLHRKGNYKEVKRLGHLDVIFKMT